MNAHLSSKLRLLFVFHLLSKFYFTAAGTCWSTMSTTGRCTEILYEKSDKENCCADHSVYTAWSADDLDSGSLFFWRVLGGGVPCVSCKESCKDVKCDPDKSCVLRKGVPKCVCSSKCKEGKLKSKGPVCGSDGRSYRNICRLKKRACRKKSPSLMVAYSGICQNSCDRINCPTGKNCVLDQNLSPHCVYCDFKCPTSPKRRQVCGIDGNSYPSPCHLKQKTCRQGRAIPLAYKGPCRANASCSNVQCRDQQACLTDFNTGLPRCTTCNLNCRPRQMRGPICATNNVTYHSWCHMMQDSCTKGVVVETKYNGKCDGALNT